MAWIAAVVSAVVSYKQAEDQKKAAEKANKANAAPRNVDTHRWSDTAPWEPSQDHRYGIMGEAQRLYENSRANPLGGGGGGGAATSALSDQQKANLRKKGYSEQQIANAGKRAAGGGGGGKNRPSTPQGPSQPTYKPTDLAQEAARRAMGTSPLMQTGQDYLSGVLQDRYGGNELLGETYDRASDYNNENLDAVVRSLMGETGLGGEAGASAGEKGQKIHYGTVASAYGGGGGAGVGPGTGAVGASGYIKDILDGKYLTENPQLQAVLDAANRRTTEQYQQGLAGLSAAAEGAGRLGGGSHQVADALQAQKFGQTLSDTEATTRYNDYNARMADIMQALGYGTGYDEALMANETQRQGISASAGASSAATAAAAKNAQVGQLLDALQMQNQVGQFGIQGMGGMAELLQGARGDAASMIPGYEQQGMSNLASAFGMGSELNRQRAAANAQNFNRKLQLSRLPWENLSNYSDLVNAMSSGYGQQHSWEQGQVPGGYSSPYMGPSPVAAGISGGLSGYQLGASFRQNQGASQQANGTQQNPYLYG